MHANRRNRCDEIIALIDGCLADYEAAAHTPASGSAPSGRQHGTTGR